MVIRSHQTLQIRSEVIADSSAEEPADNSEEPADTAVAAGNSAEEPADIHHYSVVDSAVHY